MTPLLTACSQAPQDLQALLALTSDFRWEMDARLRFSAVEGAMVDNGRLLRHTLLGKQLLNWPAGLLRAAHEPHPLAALDRHEPFRELHLKLDLRDGQMGWFALAGLPRLDAQGHFLGYQGVASDITERLEEVSHVRHLAYHDALTGLPNRRLFLDRLEQALAQARRQGSRVAVLSIDLDQFKQINDRHGHAAGDRSLIDTARQLRAAVRQSDTVARYGGDEFVALLLHITHPHDTLAVARKMLDTLGQDSPFPVSASIGVALFPDHGFDSSTLLVEADRAMYRAKSQGGHQAQIAGAERLSLP